MSGRVAGLLAAPVTTHDAGPGRWRVELSNGARFIADARLDQDWLVLETPVAKPDSAAPAWPWLRLNADLPPGLAVVLAPDSNALRLRGSVLCEHGDPRGPMETLCRRLAAARHATDPAVSGTAPLPAPQGKPDEGLERWRDALTELGWPVIEREQRLVVPLGRRDGGVQGAVGVAPGGARVAVPVGGPTPLGPASREGLARYLLIATAVAPPVRAVMPAGEPGRVELDVSLSAPPGLDGDAALGRLAAAADRFGRTAAALADEDVARRYLIFNGWEAACTTETMEPSDCSK